MAKASAVKVELLSVSLKSVNPIVPRDKKEKEELMEDLTRMGCKGLLMEPWTLRSEAMAQEFLHLRYNQWEGTLQRDPDRWTTDLWAKVYSFRKEGRTWARRIDKYIDGKFSLSIDPKDGHAVSDCVYPRDRRILELVVPILNAEKPNRVTKVVGNTIFGALSGLTR